MLNLFFENALVDNFNATIGRILRYIASHKLAMLLDKGYSPALEYSYLTGELNVQKTRLYNVTNV